MTQLDLLKKAVELAEQNPDKEIHFFVSNELCDSYDYTSHQIERVELGYWWIDDDRIYTEIEDIADELSELEDRDITIEEAEQREDVKEAIIIYTEAK